MTCNILDESHIYPAIRQKIQDSHRDIVEEVQAIAVNRCRYRRHEAEADAVRCRCLGVRVSRRRVQPVDEIFLFLRNDLINGVWEP